MFKIDSDWDLILWCMNDDYVHFLMNVPPWMTLNDSNLMVASYGGHIWKLQSDMKRTWSASSNGSIAILKCYVVNNRIKLLKFWQKKKSFWSLIRSSETGLNPNNEFMNKIIIYESPSALLNPSSVQVVKGTGDLPNIHYPKYHHDQSPSNNPLKCPPNAQTQCCWTWSCPSP